MGMIAFYAGLIIGVLVGMVCMGLFSKIVTDEVPELQQEVITLGTCKRS